MRTLTDAIANEPWIIPWCVLLLSIFAVITQLIWKPESPIQPNTFQTADGFVKFQMPSGYSDFILFIDPETRCEYFITYGSYGNMLIRYDETGLPRCGVVK